MRDGNFGDLAQPAASAPSPDDLARPDLNDFGNGQRVILLSGGTIDDDGEVETTSSRLLQLHGVGWIGFNGRFWDREHGEDLARRMAHRVAIKVRSLEPFFADRGVPKAAFWKFADSCGSAGATTAMLRQAQSYLTVRIEDFDRDPLALNCLNGTVKMRVVDGRFDVRCHPHDPADRITRMAETRYDPDAAAPLFGGVVAASLPDEAERAFYHRALGYAATGETREQAFFLSQGRGRDGKSTILDACRETLGTYGAVGNPSTFLEQMVGSSSGATPDLIKLMGDVRFVVLSEPPRGAKLNEGRLKAWTSGSPIDARDLNKSNVTFRPVGKLIWECNAFPVARGDDDGIWRRVMPAMFRHQVPKEQVDKDLPRKLGAERSGILNWLIAGAGAWLARGLDPPASLTRVVEEYRRSSSPFGDWLGECCAHGEAAAGERELVKSLYASFKEWFEEQGFEKPMGPKAFGDAMRDRQIETRGKNAAGLQYRGPIRILSPGEREQHADRAEPSASAGASRAVGPAGAGGQSGMAAGAGRYAAARDAIADFDIPPDDDGRWVDPEEDGG